MASISLDLPQVATPSVLCLHLHSHDLSFYPSCESIFCGACWTVAHNTAHTLPSSTAVSSQALFRHCPSLYLAHRSWPSALPRVSRLLGPLPKLDPLPVQVPLALTPMKIIVPQDMFTLLFLRQPALPWLPATHPPPQRRYRRLHGPRFSPTRRPRPRRSSHHIRFQVLHRRTQRAFLPAPMLRCPATGLIRSWGGGGRGCARVLSSVHGHPRPPPHCWVRAHIYSVIEGYSAKGSGTKSDAASTAQKDRLRPCIAIIGQHRRLFDARQLTVMTDAGSQPRAKDQPSTLRKPMSLRDLIAHLCSSLSVPACPGSIHVVPWHSRERHSVSVSATVLFRCVSCALLRWHVSSASCSTCYFSGSALSAIQQPSLSHTPVRSRRPDMAASSSSKDHHEYSEDEMLRFYRSLEWTTRTPPPLTVYLLPHLQDLLKRRSQTAPRSPPKEADSKRPSRCPSLAAPAARAPRTPPGAVSSSTLTAEGVLPSRPRAPKHARASPGSTASRKRPRSSPSRRSRTPPKDPQRRCPKPSSTASSDSAATANPPGALIDAFFKTTDEVAPRVYRARCAFATLCPLLSRVTRLLCRTRPDLRPSSVHPPGQCIAPGFSPISAVPRLISALQVGSILAQTRAPAHFSFRQGPQFVIPCQSATQSKAFGRRSLCHQHAIRVEHLLSFCFDRCSHCQSSFRLYVSRPGLCYGPPFQSCHPRTTRLRLPLAITQRRLPPFSIRTRSLLPLIQQPAWLCYKEWPSEQKELRVVRCLVRPNRYRCMVPSQVHLKPLELAPHRRRFVVGAGPREPLNSPTVRLLLPSKTQRARRWMQTTMWRSEWTPPGPSSSASRFAFSLPRLLRLLEQSGTRMTFSLPVTAVLTPCPWQMIRAMQSLKRSHYSAIAMPQLHYRSARPCPFCALYSRLCPWLRSPRSPPPCQYSPCPWARPSTRRLSPTMHWLLDLAWPWFALIHRHQSTQVTSHLPLSPQALLLKASPTCLWLSTSQHDPWRSRQAACPWTASSPMPQSTRPVQISHPHQQIKNLSKRPGMLNLKHWRSCLKPPQKRTTSLLPPVRSRLPPPSRHLMVQTADTAAAAVQDAPSRITPWNHPLRRTRKSTCRSPSGAFRGDHIHDSTSSFTDGPAPNLPSFDLLHQGAARTLDRPAEHWLRLLKCVAAPPLLLQQSECTVSSIWVRYLPDNPRSRDSQAAPSHASPLPYSRLCTLSCNGSLDLQCSLWLCHSPAQNIAHYLVLPPAARAEMASRKERRQERQRSRPGLLNRRFTDAPSVEATATTTEAAVSSASTAATHSASSAPSAPSDEPCRLTVKEVALLNYVQWQGRTGKPPPLTVYAEPSLQQVLRGLRQKQRQPLPPPEDEVQVVADLIHVPDDAHNDNPRDSSVKLKPKPKTKHGSADVAPPEPYQPSRPLQPTAISSDTSMEELPCKIMAGDLTLTSHDYGKIPTHARRRPKKRPKPHKDTSKTVSTEAAPPPISKEAAIPKTAPAPPSSEGVITHASDDTAPGRHQSSSLAAASSSLAPPATVNIQPLDTALPGNQKLQAASPAPDVDKADPVSEHAAKAKKTKDPDCGP